MKVKESIDIEMQNNDMMIFDSENDCLIEINEIGKIIIEMIMHDTNTTLSDIAERIQNEYDCKNENVIDDINEFVLQMTDLGIIT